MSEEEFAKLPHFICEVIEKWAKEKPDSIALIDADDDKKITWKEFNQSINVFAIKLWKMGFKKGDILITSLPYLMEHIFLAYACAKLGVMWCPLDLRLKPNEILRNLSLLKEKTKMYCHLGKTSVANFGMIGKAVKDNCPWIDYFVQFSPPGDRVRKGIIPAYELASQAKKEAIEVMQNPEGMKAFEAECAKVREDDPILIVFTTGTTGWPKPAMITNVGITSQNMCLSKGFDVEEDDSMLVNLPASHVGGNAEQLMTPLFIGATAVVLHIFDPVKTLKAIEKYRVTTFGQIPALFEMEWRLPDYDKYDLSSLKFALYGGQQVTRIFLEKLSKMAPKFGSGLGLTEISGFCSYTPLDGTVDDILDNLGHDYPITPLSIRKPMKKDGSAGDEMSIGQIGEICYTGPQVFKGYFGNEEATRKTISTDGVLYTGDLGFKDEKGNLHLSGRAKLMIKPKGYNVFPIEVEEHISKLNGVASVGVVGAQHNIFTEGIVAYVQLKPGAKLTEKQVIEHCKQIASYKRPSLVVFVDEMPLNRVAKTDYKVLKERVEQDVKEKREAGGWDAK
jgi:fatty-acyl-CoA synthase